MSALARFLDRWNRRKLGRASSAAAGPLPPLETLADDADLSPYLAPEVEASLRLRALKRIFSDPRLNAMDGLDVYIDDYSVADPIPAAMLARLTQACRRLGADDGAEDARPVSIPADAATDDPSETPTDAGEGPE